MRLLLIEDDTEIAEFFTSFFEMSGYGIIHAASGLDGLEFARREQFDAVLIDLDLPDSDGIQIGHTLRQQRKDLPIIAVTAQVDKATRLKANTAGFSAFITKPCIKDDLLKIIQGLTHKAIH